MSEEVTRYFYDQIVVLESKVKALDERLASIERLGYGVSDGAISTESVTAQADRWLRDIWTAKGDLIPLHAFSRIFSKRAKRLKVDLVSLIPSNWILRTDRDSAARFIYPDDTYLPSHWEKRFEFPERGMTSRGDTRRLAKIEAELAEMEAQRLEQERRRNDPAYAQAVWEAERDKALGKSKPVQVQAPAVAPAESKPDDAVITCDNSQGISNCPDDELHLPPAKA